MKFCAELLDFCFQSSVDAVKQQKTMNTQSHYYKVVQIWPELFTPVYTQISHGHIWTTL